MTQAAAQAWSVKGVDPGKRELARNLARRSNLTLGEWLNTFIAESDRVGRSAEATDQSRGGDSTEAAESVLLIDGQESLATSQPSLKDAQAVAEGLPVSALERLADRIAPDDAGLKHRLVPKATYARRKGAQQRLTPEESERVVRLARVWAFALHAFGKDEKAQRFMIKPHWQLEGRTPVDLVLESEVGAKVVEQIIGRGLYGIPL